MQPACHWFTHAQTQHRLTAQLAQPLSLPSPPSFPGSLSCVRRCRRMRNHDIHCRKHKPCQHRHDVAPALAFYRAFLPARGTVARLRRRLAAAGRDKQSEILPERPPAQAGRTYEGAGIRELARQSEFKGSSKEPASEPKSPEPAPRFY